MYKRQLPSYPTLKSYIELLLDTPEFFVMFWNSVKIVFFSVAGQLLFGIPAAWGFARYKFPFKKILFTIYIVVMLMPFQVTMLSSYLVLDTMHLLDSHASIDVYKRQKLIYVLIFRYIFFQAHF